MKTGSGRSNGGLEIKIDRATSIGRTIAAVFAASVALGVASGVCAQAASDSSRSIQLGRGKSHIEEVGPYAQLLVGDEKIADVVPTTGHSFSILSKKFGVTTVSVFGPNKRLIEMLSVYVNVDVNELKSRIHAIMPEETGVAVSGALDEIVLSGPVSSGSAVRQLMDLASAYAPKVVNLMSVEGTQQVMLSVRFVEMQRSASKGLNLSLQGARTGNPGLYSAVGNSAIGGIGTQGAGNLTKFTVPTTAYAAGLAVINGDIGLEFDALETRGLTKTLAEPTLMAMSGDTASFLAGGEVPVYVPQIGNGANGTSIVTVQFKNVGISLKFTPTVLKGGLINLHVNPEVSSVDPTVGIQSNGINVTGFKVRNADTTVELRDGESFMIAGLLSDNYKSNVSAMPFVSDIPILGALFRSPSFQKDQSELVIIVTPHLAKPSRATLATPADHFVPPSDYELFLFGAQHGASAAISPEDRSLMSHDPSKGGVDGAYGHVVY